MRPDLINRESGDAQKQGGQADHMGRDKYRFPWIGVDAFPECPRCTLLNVQESFSIGNLNLTGAVAPELKLLWIPDTNFLGGQAFPCACVLFVKIEYRLRLDFPLLQDNAGRFHSPAQRTGVCGVNLRALQRIAGTGCLIPPCLAERNVAHSLKFSCPVPFCFTMPD